MPTPNSHGVLEDIFDLMTNSAPVTAFVGQRIWPGGVSPQNPQRPFIVYELVSMDVNYCLDGHFGGDRVTVQVTIVCRNSVEAREVGNVVLAAIDQVVFGGGNTQEFLLEDDRVDCDVSESRADTKVFRRVLTFHTLTKN